MRNEWRGLAADSGTVGLFETDTDVLPLAFQISESRLFIIFFGVGESEIKVLRVKLKLQLNGFPEGTAIQF